MSYAKGEFGKLSECLARKAGTLEQALDRTFTEAMPCQREDFDDPKHYDEWKALRAQATAEPGETGRLLKTLAKMTEQQRESMRDRLLNLARRIDLSSASGAAGGAGTW